MIFLSEDLNLFEIFTLQKNYKKDLNPNISKCNCELMQLFLALITKKAKHK